MFVADALSDFEMIFLFVSFLSLLCSRNIFSCFHSDIDSRKQEAGKWYEIIYMLYSNKKISGPGAEFKKKV